MIVKIRPCPLAVEWVADSFDIDVLVVLRHPANVLASWLELDLPDRDRVLDHVVAVQDRYARRWNVSPPGPEPLDRSGVATRSSDRCARRGSDPASASGWSGYTRTCVSILPPSSGGSIAELGLEWTDAVDRASRPAIDPDADSPCRGRRRRRPTPGDRRLGPAEARALRRVLGAFPLRHWSADDMPGDACAG